MKNSIIYILSVLLLASCIKKSDIIIPESKPKIVINCFLYSGEQIQAHISASNYILNDTTYVLEGATVLLQKNNEPKDTLTLQNGFYTKKDLIIEPGACYSIEVSKKGYSTATAQDCVPATVMIENFTHTDEPELDEWGQTLYKATLTFKDNPEWGDFYYPLLKTDSSFIYSEGQTEYKQESSELNFSVDEDYNYYGENVIRIMSDSAFTQEQVNISFYYYPVYGYFDSLQYYLQTALYKPSYAYYKYNLSLTDVYGMNEDNVSVYSNVSGGYGIFAGVGVSNYIPWNHTFYPQFEPNPWEEEYIYY